MLKLVHLERESRVLRSWLESRDVPLAGSDLLSVELTRACRRVNPSALGQARVVLATLHLVPLTRFLLGDAAELGSPLLRSLDAIHLASALSIRGELSAFVVYDERLAEAATAAGLHVVAPGSDGG